MPYLFFASPLLRLRGTLRGAQRKILSHNQAPPPPPYLSLHRNNRNPITFVFVTQILINAVYERDPNRPALSPRGRRGQAVRRNAKRMAGAQYISSSVAAESRAKNGLTLRLRLRTSFCSTSLISQMSLAEARPRSCVCRLIYDLCSRREGGVWGGALGRSATSTSRHTATTGHKKRERGGGGWGKGTQLCSPAHVRGCACAANYGAAVLDLHGFGGASRSQSEPCRSQLRDACISVCVLTRRCSHSSVFYSSCESMKWQFSGNLIFTKQIGRRSSDDVFF